MCVVRRIFLVSYKISMLNLQKVKVYTVTTSIMNLETIMINKMRKSQVVKVKYPLMRENCVKHVMELNGYILGNNTDF
jgi:hypothetical protein